MGDQVVRCRQCDRRVFMAWLDRTLYTLDAEPSSSDLFSDLYTVHRCG